MEKKKKSDSSEIVLKVKRRIFRVKKDILIKESKYFEALLSGNYSDSDTTEVNLTHTVEDIQVLKSVVWFMSVGHISLNDQNIEQVAHLSSYLGIDKLQYKCTKYIKENLVCEDWLKCYFLALRNGLSEVLHYTEAFISSRMHDLLIYEAETLKLHPDQLEHLWKNGYLKFCTFDSLALFITKWLCKSDDVEDRKLTVALDVLENAQKVTVLPNDKDIEKELNESVKKLNKLLKVKGKRTRGNQVLKILEETVSDSKGGKDDTKFKTKDVPEKLKPGSKPERITAIFAASERLSLRRRIENVESEESCNHGNSILDGMSDITDVDDMDDEDITFNIDEDRKAIRMIDLCVYNTQSDTWYHLDELNEREYMGQYSYYFYDWTKNLCDDVEFEITACDTHVLFSDKNTSSEAVVLDIKNKTWKKLNWKQWLEDDFDEEEHIRTQEFIVGDNNMIFLVLCIQIKEENERGHRQGSDAIGMVCFRVYNFDPESLEFVLMCETDSYYNVPSCTDWHRYFRQTNCYISEVRKEMVLTHYEGSGLNVIFLVNLEDTNSTPKEVLKKVTDKDNLLFKEVEILETKKEYIIVTKEDDTLSVKLQYSFETEVVTEVENGQIHKLCKNEDRYMECDKVRYITAKRVEDSKKSLCQESSFWQIEQYLDFGNIFAEVRFEKTGKPKVINHRPPPSTQLISVSSAIVDNTFFQDLKPVKHFLCRSD